MAQLTLRLADLPFTESFAGNNGGRGTEGVTRQVDQCRNGKGDKVTGNDIGAHPGNKHLGQQLTAVEQHGFNAGRHANTHHFPDNGEIKRLEIALDTDAQGRVKTDGQHHDDGNGADIARDRQPEPGPDKAQPVPGKEAINQHAADHNIQDVHPAVDQQRNFGVPCPAQRPAANQRNRCGRIAEHRHFEIGQRQGFHLTGRLASHYINNLFTEIVDHRRQHNGEQRHDHQRQPGGRPRTTGIAFPQTKGHHHRGTKIDRRKERNNHHIKAVGQPDACHRLFAEPADQEGAEHAHQQDAGVFQKDRHGKGGDFAPEENLVALTFGIPGRAHHGLA